MAGPRLTSLIDGAARERWVALALGIAGGAVGFSLGFGLRDVSPALAADKLFLLTLALVAPLPMAAVGACYHNPLHRLLLPWPVSASAHFALGLRGLARGQWPWLLAATAAGIGAAWGRPPSAGVGLVALPPAIALGGFGAALGAAGLSAALADAEGEGFRKLRGSLAGPFASPRHAPFFYLPALAFGVTAVAGVVALGGALGLATAPEDALRWWAYLASPLASGVLWGILGWLGYRVCGLRTIARVHEEARTIYGGRPAPEEPPYGAALLRALPATLVPYAGKELREQSRSHKALWAILALLALACGVYAINVGPPLPAAPLMAALVVVYVGTLPLRRSPRAVGAEYLITLPWRPGAALMGRWLALLWPLGHLCLVAGLTLAYRHGVAVALQLLALAVATSLAACALTGLRAKRAGGGQSWGPTAQLVPALAVAAALLSQRWPRWGLGTIAALALFGLVGAALRAKGGRPR